MYIIVIIIISADLRKKLDPLIISAIVLGLALGLLVLVVLQVALVLFYKYKGRGQKFDSIKGMLDELVKQKPNLPDDEVKKHLNNLHKAHLKLMFPNMRIEFDAADNLNRKPVIMFTQFLEDSFIEGFKSDDRKEFITSFTNITSQLPPTEGVNSNDDTDDRETKDQASGTNDKTADESKDAPTLSCMTSQV